MSEKRSLGIARKALVIGLMSLTLFSAAAAGAQPASEALSPAQISALAAQFGTDVGAAPAPAQIYAVIARFAQTNIASRGPGSASAITSVVLAAATLPGAHIRDVDLGDGLAHAAFALGAGSDAARDIAATVAREASRPVRNYFSAIIKALTGSTALADIAGADVGSIGSISGNAPLGLGIVLKPNLPGLASCLNPSCTQL